MAERHLAKLSPMYWFPGIDWNHNEFYDRFLLRQVPAHATRALEIGCGTGAFAGRLAQCVAHVDAIDRDEQSLVLARQRVTAENVMFRNMDLLTGDLEPASYDFVTCNTVIHHMPFDAAAKRMRELVAPGGVIAIVGLARMSGVDFARAAVTVPLDVAMGIGYRIRRGASVLQEAPVKEPEMTMAEIKDASARVWPGARFRRRLFYRYTVVFGPVR